jgi:hypothetical protein
LAEACGLDRMEVSRADIVVSAGPGDFTALRRERIGRRVGRISDAEIAAIDRALALWLELGVAR